MDEQRASAGPPSESPSVTGGGRPEGPPPLDPAGLDWLLKSVRQKIRTCSMPLYHLYVWYFALRIYLERSQVDSRLYVEEFRDGLRSAFDKGAPLYDPEFLTQLRALADHPRLHTEQAADLGAEVTRMLLSATYAAYAVGAGRTPSGAAEVPVLLVWRRPGIMSEDVSFGLPLMLSVRASTRRKAWGVISWEGSIANSNGGERLQEFLGVDSIALAAAVACVPAKRAKLDYEVHVTAENGALQGKSLGLPLATVLLAFEQRVRGRVARWPRPDAVLTGEIAPDGAVLPVDADCLREKVRAAVGAQFTAFGLPCGNLDTALDELKRMTAIEPSISRPLLVPIAHLREVSVHDALTREMPPRESPRIVRPRWRYGTLGAIFLAGLVWWLFGNPWTERARLEIEGGSSSMVHASMPGLPPRSRTFLFNASIDNPQNGVRVFREVPSGRPMLVVTTGIRGTEPCRVHLFDLRTGKRRWCLDLSRRLPLSGEAYRQNRFMAEAVLPVDFDCDGGTDLLVKIQAAPASPCAVVWLDAQGEERGLYAHRGYIWAQEAVDYDHDGLPELICRGTLNTDTQVHNQSATVVVLNAKHFAAWPHAGPFADSAQAPFDSSLAEIVFPPIPELCSLTGEPGFVITKLDVAPSPPPSRMTAHIHPVGEPGLLVTLDQEFRVVNVVAEDALVPLVEGWVVSGKLREDFLSSDRLAAYQAEVQVSTASARGSVR